MMETQTDTEKPQVRVFKANTSLQKRVGTGAVDTDKIRKAEEAMRENSFTFEFEPMANEYLDKLAHVIEKGRKNPDISDELRESMTEIVMELKGNAALFQYDLIGSLAGVMLSFLESIQTVDKDALDIIQAHHQTLKAIISRQMRGTGGQYGQQLEQELRSVCVRYLKRARA